MPAFWGGLFDMVRQLFFTITGAGAGTVADTIVSPFAAVFVGIFWPAEKTGVMAMLETILRRTADKCQNRRQPCQLGVNLGVLGARRGPDFGRHFVLLFGSVSIRKSRYQMVPR